MQESTSTTVPINFVRNILDAVPDRGVSHALVEQSGIPLALLEEGSARVTTDQFSTLYRLLARELDDELPGMFSRPVRGGALKLLCLSMLESANLKIALYRLSRFFHLIVDDFGVDLCEQDGLVCVVLVPRHFPSAIKVFSQEVMLRLVHGVISWLAARNIPLVQVDLAYPRPEYAAVYLDLYPGPACFDQARTALCFDARDLESSIRQNKRSLVEFLRRAPADWLVVSAAERIVSHRVREYLEQHLHEHTTITDVAQALHFSVRTLSRRLGVEGATFHAIRDELRRDVAILRLTKTDTPIAVIGAEVGFNDQTTFHRAFKKWTGSTPGAYRSKA